MIIDFTKLSPGGNDTIIVRSAVVAAKRAGIARTLMSSPYVGGEQVGYLTLAPASGIDARLDMMGGELCVNALRSAAALITTERGYRGMVRLLSSGSPDPLLCYVHSTGSSAYVRLDMPCALTIERLDEDTALVDFGGIMHFVCTSGGNFLSDSGKIFADLRQRYAQRIETSPACGLIVVSETQGRKSIQPLVYVRATETVIPETACGSGSIAAAVIERMQGGSRYLSLLQPSGTTFDLDVEQAESSWVVKIGSPVDFLIAGKAYIPDSDFPEI